MLTARLSPRGAGLEMAGDYLDLDAMHRTLHAMCGDDADGELYPENLIFQLAYDIRKARDGMRTSWRAQGFNGRSITYRSVTVSLVRVSIQFAFLLRVVRGRTLPMAHTATIHTLGAVVVTALAELGFDTPERFLTRVAVAVNGWKEWPSANLVDAIDREFLFDLRTKTARRERLAELPELLASDGTFARSVERMMAEAAKEQGVSPDHLRIKWPDRDPLF